MSLADDIVNGNYSYTNKKKKKDEEQIQNQKETIADKIVNGTYRVNDNNIDNVQQFTSNNKISGEEENKENSTSLWKHILGASKDLGRIAENAFLGLKNGINYFQQTFSRRLDETTNDRFNMNKQITEEALASRLNKNPSEAEEISQILNKTTSVQKQMKESQQKALDKKQEKINKNNEKINQNIESIENSILKKGAELAPSVGQMIPMFIPGAGIVYATGSATGQYYDDAKQRGMNDEEANLYSGLMGLAEGATEMIGIDKFKSAGKVIKTAIKGAGKETTKQVGKSALKLALKDYGIGIADNVMQEAIIEPIQEVTAQTVAGKEKADWNNMGERMLQSGINGGLVAAIMGGANLGVESCVGVVKKAQNSGNITQEEFKIAVQDASKQVDVEKMIIDSTNQQVNKYKDYNTNQELNSDTQNLLNKANDIIKDSITVESQESLENKQQTITNGNQSNNIPIREKTKDLKQETMNFITKNNIANNEKTLYNNVESESDINATANGNRIATSNMESQNEIASQKLNEKYRRYEQQAREQEITEITEQQQRLKNHMKNSYNKNIVIYDDTNSEFSGGLSKTDGNTIFFGKNALDNYGEAFLSGHELAEDMYKNHSNITSEDFNNLIEKIQNDDKFGDIFLDYITDMDANIKEYYIEHPELIAKEVLCDTLGFMQNDNELNANLEHKDIADVWVNQLNEDLLKEIKQSLKAYHDEIYTKENKATEQESLLDWLDKKHIDYEVDENNNITSIENEKALEEYYQEEQNIDVLPTIEKATKEKIANILEKPPEKVQEKDRKWAIFKASILDKGIVFEELSQKTKNRELQGKWDYTLTSMARGQNAIGNARYELDAKTKTKKQVSKSLEEIRQEVGGNVQSFSEYMYHALNVDRMTLEERFGGDTGINYEEKNVVKNKPVFGQSVTAETSQNIVNEYEEKYPEFKKWAKDVYDYNNANQQELVKNGVISQELADKLNEMYPHYVPIKRVNTKGNAIKVPLDTNKTGINSPLAKAKGGDQDIQPLFETMADRTLQTYKASARNSFGVELMNTIKSQQQIETTDIDTILEDMGDVDANNELLKEGKNGNNPTFTVFDKGKKITFEITKDMFDALKPLNDSSVLSKTFKVLNKISNFRRAVLTEYNPLFFITNPIKDVQDVLINSQHSAKTYSKFPEAYAQIVKKGYWYDEYVQNGGEQNSYFKDGKFESDTKLPISKKVLTMPLRAISNINGVIEMAPRLAEYIASREAGRSIETSMLDASRVTTNFKAGGDITKFANRNGATFLNASVQGAVQQVRNIKEANIKGLKGWTILACKYVIAGLPTVLLNNLIWGDDEDYEELQDYVKDNYYCLAKYGDGKFIRIPKGRTVATIQKVVSNAEKYITEGKEINIDNLAKDFWENLNFAIDNLAPNNPIDNNVISPIIQAITNTSWYGEDIVPSRLQDKPKAEQYDETTDAFSKWLGEKLNQSPYKINYLLDQYGGGISDVLLPMMTPQAENNVFEDKFTASSTMKSKYPGDFFTKVDELKVNSNSSKATDEDIVKYKYMSSVSNDIGELYAKKREIQNSSLTDEKKKEQLQEVQEEINTLAKNSLEVLENTKITSTTATIGEAKYYKYNDEWTKLTEEEEEKNKEISLKTYADYKNQVYQATQSKRATGELDEDASLKNKDKIQILLDSKYTDKEVSSIYENYIKSSKDTEYNVIKSTNMNIKQYLEYKQQEFTSDKEDNGTLNGKTVSGSKRNKVVSYLNSMKITGKQRLLLYAINGYSTSSSQKAQIVEYVNSLDLKKEEKLELYDKFSGFTVYKNGKVYYK